jgi:phosphate:Na+ symporter
MTAHINRRFLVGLSTVIIFFQCAAVLSEEFTSTTALGVQSKPIGSIVLERPFDDEGRDISGSGQTGLVNSRLNEHLEVRAVDLQKAPIEGIKIAFKILRQPPDVQKGLAIHPVGKGTTDSEGLYRAGCVLGDQPGEYEVLFYVPTASGDVSFLRYTVTAHKASWANWLVLGLIGGVAIFLFGMKLAADGLHESGGVRLRSLIGDMTKSRVKGVGFGAVTTFLMQSSSATTTMLVSLVNAKLMSVRQTIGMIFGAAIGTTITVQLISFNVADYSLLLIALGFILTVTMKRRRYIALGNILLGFGFIFFGMKVMSDVTAPLKDFAAFQNTILILTHYPMWAMIFAALFTALFQSSAATLGIVISISRQGVFTLPATIPLIFGANIGTCATALLASLSASRDGKRVAWAHLFFKVFGVLIFFPFMTYLATVGAGATHFMASLPVPLGSDSMARQIANTHLIFNVLIALIFFPFMAQLEKLVYGFLPRRPDETLEVRSKYLDLQILDTPSIAIGSCIREISRMARFVEEMMRTIGEAIFNREDRQWDFIHTRDDKVDKLQTSITRYLTNLTQKKLSEEELAKSIGLLYIVSDLENIGDIIDKNLLLLAQKMYYNNLEFSEAGKKELQELHHKVSEDLSATVVALTSSSREIAERVTGHKHMLTDYGQKLHLQHLKRLKEGLRETIETSSVHLDVINYLLRIEFHVYRIACIVAGKGIKYRQL